MGHTRALLYRATMEFRILPFFGFETNNLSVGITNVTANSWVFAPFGTLGVSNVTFTAWIYPVGVQNAWAGIIYDWTGDVGGVSYYGSSNMIGYTWGLNNSSTYNWASGFIPLPNQWSFVAVTISPTQARRARLQHKRSTFRD